MNGETDHVRAPVGRFGENAFVPLSVADQLHGIREAEAAENQFVPLGIDEFVSLYFHPFFFAGRTRCRHDERQRRDDDGSQILFHDGQYFLVFLFRTNI